MNVKKIIPYILSPGIIGTSAAIYYLADQFYPEQFYGTINKVYMAADVFTARARSDIENLIYSAAREIGQEKGIVEPRTKRVKLTRPQTACWFTDGYGEVYPMDLKPGDELDVIDSDRNDVRYFLTVSQPNIVGLDGYPVYGQISVRNLVSVDNETKNVSEGSSKVVFKTDTYKLPTKDKNVHFDVGANTIAKPVRGSTRHKHGQGKFMEVSITDTNGVDHNVFITEREVRAFDEERDSGLSEKTNKIQRSRELTFKGTMRLARGAILRAPEEVRSVYTGTKTIKPGELVVVERFNSNSGMWIVSIPGVKNIPSFMAKEVDAFGLVPLKKEPSVPKTFSGRNTVYATPGQF